MLAAAGALGTGCTQDIGSSSDNVTDVPHTDVERQSIGNCWLYAQASWVESMNLAATGEQFDVSQSYWTYWHWYDEITSGWGTDDEISTGGNQWTSNDLVRERGIMPEIEFVPDDSRGEMSYTQESALNQVNRELSDGGRLETREARQDRALVRQVLDEAWGLSPQVIEYLNTAFGEDGSRTLRNGGTTDGTPIVAAEAFPVRYTVRDSYSGEVSVKDTTVDVAIDEWHTESYPGSGYWGGSAEGRRDFQIRVQRALHDSQPVVITWDVDFNAMESDYGDDRIGSFNLRTLQDEGGPGRQGGHMTVLEDYQAVTQDYGLLAAGVTLDPEIPEDAAKLEAALEPSTEIVFFRIKNSWGAFRDDRASAPGFPGYHDLYMDYMDGPIDWCPSVDDKTEESCTGTTVPFNSVMLPPGY
jgi:hypothetical protein